MTCAANHQPNTPLVDEICADSLKLMRASAQTRIVVEVRIAVFQKFQRGNLRQARAVLGVERMLSGRLLGLVLVLIGLIVIGLSAFVIYFSTSAH
jgi:hypothetical protein